MKSVISYGIFSSTAVAAGILLTMAGCSGGGGSGTSASSEDSFPITVKASFNSSEELGASFESRLLESEPEEEAILIVPSEPQSNFVVAGTYTEACSNNRPWSFSGVLNTSNVLEDIEVDNLKIRNRSGCALIVQNIRSNSVTYTVADGFTIGTEYAGAAVEAPASAFEVSATNTSATEVPTKSLSTALFFNAFLTPPSASASAELTFVYSFDRKRVPVRNGKIPVNGSVSYPITGDDIASLFASPPDFNASLLQDSGITLDLNSFNINAISGGFQFLAKSSADEYIRTRVDIDLDSYETALAALKSDKQAALNALNTKFTKGTQKRDALIIALDEELYNQPTSPLYINPAHYTTTDDDGNPILDSVAYASAVADYISNTEVAIDGLNATLNILQTEIVTFSINPTLTEVQDLFEPYVTDSPAIALCVPELQLVSSPYEFAEDMFSSAAAASIVRLTDDEKTTFVAPFEASPTDVHSLNYEVDTDIIADPNDVTLWVYLFKKEAVGLFPSYSVFCGSALGESNIFDAGQR